MLFLCVRVPGSPTAVGRDLWGRVVEPKARDAEEDAMESSPELRDLTLGVFRAMTTGDAAFVARTFSRQPGVLGIGTDPAEWWADYPTLERVMTAQLQEMGAGGIQIIGSNPQAYQEGNVGWAADQFTLQMPDGAKIPARLTLVAHREGGAWKIVQFHTSVGARNEEVLGQSLTVE